MRQPFYARCLPVYLRKYAAYLKISCFFLTLLIATTLSVKAQFPYSETFKNATAPGLVISGAAKLTAAAAIDPAGQGYLRLTENATNGAGYVYGVDSFPSNYGLTASFEFFIHKPGASSTNQADGMTFFLFDAAVNAFRPGGSGGSLGYAQYYSTPGMAKGYIGISIDEFGNFSSATDGAKSGGPGQKKGAVAIRGPGDGKSSSDYVYQTGVVASDAPYNAGFAAFTQRYPDSTTANYRRIKVILTPGSSLGASTGYKITVIMYRGGTPVTPVTLISNFDYPFVAPAFLQFGLAASTGSLSCYHEIRNLNIEVSNTTSLVAPTLANDNGAVACQGGKTLIDVTANDHTSNTGGSINRESVDLDPAVAGIQTSFTDAGKGTYTVDTNGIVTFIPLNGFSGTSSAQYKVGDTYGINAAAAATITINVGNNPAPLLTISDPAAICAPGMVDITNATYKVSTSPGATYHYFNNISDANANISNIDVAAAAISQPGVYYIKASLNGCDAVRPITVQIHTSPSASNAGADQNFCSSTNGKSTTLLGNNPDIGVGTWTQVSGPSAASITYPNAATTPVYNMNQAVYIFRWNIQNGACAAKTDDVQVSVGVSSNAGTAQTIANAVNTTLAANAVAPATGTWSQVSGPAATITSINDPNASITGLTAGNTYVFSWTVTNGSCVNASQVTITDVLNTVANAGPDKAQSGLADLILQGNTPGAGNSGMWSVVSKPSRSAAQIVAPTQANTTVSPIDLLGDYTFRWTITNGSFNNADDVTYRVSATLPLTWLSFTGDMFADHVLLQWNTASEQNNDHFDIERSEDGAHFYTVAKMDASRNPQDNYTYSYSDPLKDVSASNVFYRLKQVDKDLQFSYSTILKISIANKIYFKLWPNPAVDNLTITVNDGVGGNAVISLFDVAGRTIRAYTESIKKGTNNIAVRNIRELAPGLYYIQVKTTNTAFRQSFLKE